jgi:hypothetical protein
MFLICLFVFFLLLLKFFKFVYYVLLMLYQDTIFYLSSKAAYVFSIRYRTIALRSSSVRLIVGFLPLLRSV